MKIGIITLFHNGNYGASLQAYALNHVLTSYGNECQDIRYTRVSKGESDRKSNWKNRLKMLGVKTQRKVFCKKAFLRITLRKKLKKRTERIALFENAFIPQSSEKYCGINDMVSANFDYDLYVCGSDNIWNIHKFDPTFFLAFEEDSKNKYSYAAGFSVSELTDQQRDEILPLISKLSVASVREIDGYNLLSNYLPKDRIRVDLDPTLLLTADDWEKVSGNLPALPSEYIFCYILGDLEFPRAAAKHLSETMKIPIINIPHATTIQANDVGLGDMELYDVGPSEFLTLVKNAKYVFTDSFHGSIFSLIFHKQFLAFRRFATGDTKANLNRRIDNLLDRFGLLDRLISNMPLDDVERRISEEIDYDYVEKNLGSARQDSLLYLKSISEREEL